MSALLIVVVVLVVVLVLSGARNDRRRSSRYPLITELRRQVERREREERGL